MNMPYFSIIIPVYNVAQYLRECLDSILAQTFASWEAICVDDGSTDGSGAILDEYVAKDDRIKILHKTNEGVSVARNVGLELAKGKYLMFVDSDDSISADALHDFAQVLDRYKVDCLLVNPFLSTEDRSCPIRVLEGGVKPIELLVGKHSAGGWPFCRVYRREKFGALRFIPGMRLREDMCFWSDALCVDAKFAVASKPFYRYRERSNSASCSVTYKTASDLLMYPAYVIKNMRNKMGASDEEVKKFWNLEVRSLALDPYFRSWASVDRNSREKMIRLYDDVVEELGFNPCDKLIRLCVNLARHRLVDSLIVLLYFIRRCLRKLGMV